LILIFVAVSRIKIKRVLVSRLTSTRVEAVSMQKLEIRSKMDNSVGDILNKKTKKLAMWLSKIVSGVSPFLKVNFLDASQLC
jgi:hypothetical protein